MRRKESANAKRILLSIVMQKPHRLNQRVVSSCMKGMALAQTLHSKCRPTPNPIFADGKIGVFRTTGKKAASRRQERRNDLLV
jgi:hypothetical protein